MGMKLGTSNVGGLSFGSGSIRLGNGMVGGSGGGGGGSPSNPSLDFTKLENSQYVGQVI